MTKIRWGILSTGAIAHTFAEALQDVEDAELVAVGSRTKTSADAFAKKFGIASAHASYEALANDENVDVIYIATPHVFHKDNTLLCLNAGKHVLCEKPLALNRAEVAEMVQVARDKKLFLMEALWTRFLPHMTKLRELIDEGVLGELRMLQASFGFRMGEVDRDSRLFNPDLGGGSLLDVGVYSVMLSQWLFGAPEEILSFATLGQTGVDEEAAFMFRHSEGRISQLSSAIQLEMADSATIMGTKGRIHIPDWWQPSRLELTNADKETEILDIPCELNGYAYEAIEVGRCIREGALESSVAPHQDSLDIHATLDALRQQWHLVYPQEA